MNSALPPDPESAPCLTPEMLAADAVYYRQVLHGLIEISADMVRMAHREALGNQAEPQSYAEAIAIDAADSAGRAVGRMERSAAVVERLSRCVRRSIGLARQLSEPVRARPGSGAGPQGALVAGSSVGTPGAFGAGTPGAFGVGTPGHGLRREVLRSVEDAIHKRGCEVDAEALRAELYERLDTPEFSDDLGRRPVADLITEICRDLGLKADYWLRRRPEDLAAMSERAKGRAPLVTWWPGPGEDEAGLSGPVPPLAGARRGPGQSPGAA